MIALEGAVVAVGGGGGGPVYLPYLRELLGSDWYRCDYYSKCLFGDCFLLVLGRLDCRLNIFNLNLIAWNQLRRVGHLGKDPFWMGVMEDLFIDIT